MTAQTMPAFDTAIRNPENPDHLMVIKDVPRRIRIYQGAALLADDTCPSPKPGARLTRAPKRTFQ